MIHVSGVCFLFFQRSTTTEFDKSLTILLSRVVDITSRGCVEAIPPALSFDMVHNGVYAQAEVRQDGVIWLDRVPYPCGLLREKLAAKIS